MCFLPCRWLRSHVGFPVDKPHWRHCKFGRVCTDEPIIPTGLFLYSCTFPHPRPWHGLKETDSQSHPGSGLSNFFQIPLSGFSDKPPCSHPDRSLSRMRSEILFPFPQQVRKVCGVDGSPWSGMQGHSKAGPDSSFKLYLHNFPPKTLYFQQDWTNSGTFCKF